MNYRQLAEHTLSHFPLAVLKKCTANPAIFPYYHSVSDHIPCYFENSYPIKTRQEFEKDLCFLLKHYKPIELNQLLQHVQENKPLPPNSFHLTFDDGYSEVYHTIYPLLKRKGIPATVFLCSALVDNKAMHWEQMRQVARVIYNSLSPLKKKMISGSFLINNVDIPTYINQLKYGDRATLSDLLNQMEADINVILEKEKPYLDTRQIHEMIENGYTFGAHSVDHPPFQEIKSEEQFHQINESVNSITKIFHLPYRVFAFPYGEFALSLSSLEELLNQANIHLAFGTRGIIPDENKNLIQRIWMESGYSPYKTLKMEYARKTVRKKVNHDIVKRRLPSVSYY